MWLCTADDLCAAKQTAAVHIIQTVRGVTICNINNNNCVCVHIILYIILARGQHNIIHILCSYRTRQFINDVCAAPVQPLQSAPIRSESPRQIIIIMLCLTIYYIKIITISIIIINGCNGIKETLRTLSSGRIITSS